MGNSVQPQVNSTKDRLLDFDKTIAKASVSIPTFGGRRFTVEGKKLSYNDLLKQFSKLVPTNPSTEEKMVGNTVFIHLKQLDEKAANTLKNQHIVKRILTAICSFIGNITANRTGTINDIEKKLQLSLKELTLPPGQKTPEKKAQQSGEVQEQPQTRTAYPDLQEALGGLEAFDNLPVLAYDQTKVPSDYMNFLEPGDLTAPVMRGIKPNGAPFIAFRFVKVVEGKSTELCETWTRRKDEVFPNGIGHQIAMGVRSFVNGEESSKAPLDRVKRLLEGKPVGLLKERKNATGKPEYYEETPVPGTSEIKLWKPPAV